MSGPLGVVALLLLQAAAGTLVVLWGVGTWGQARRGFTHLTGVSAALLAWAGWLTARAAVADTPTAAGEAPLGAVEALPPVALAAAVALTAWQFALLAGTTWWNRVFGVAATLVAVAAVALAGASRGERVALAVAEAGLGAVFLGSALVGLLLGHWYLFERRLSNRYMITSARWYAVGSAAGAGAVALSALNPAPPLGGFSPFLAVPGFSLWLGGGLVAVCALIAGFTLRLAHEGGRSIQAATGLMYLAVIMAFSAEMAAKSRFF